MAHKKKGSKKGTSVGNGASKPQAPAAQANGEPHSYKEAVTSNLDINGSGTFRSIVRAGYNLLGRSSSKGRRPVAGLCHGMILKL